MTSSSDAAKAGVRAHQSGEYKVDRYLLELEAKGGGGMGADHADAAAGMSRHPCCCDSPRNCPAFGTVKMSRQSASVAVFAASCRFGVRRTQYQSTASATCLMLADKPMRLLGADPGSLDPVAGASNDVEGPAAESSGELSASVSEDKPQFPGLSWWRALMGRWRREDHESYACYALMVRS